MAKSDFHFLKQGSRVLEIDPRTLQNIIELNGLPHFWADGRMLLTDQTIALARPLVHAWKNRPRMSKRGRAAAATS
jgi:hypothetical protein